MESSPGPLREAKYCHQKCIGPAPFASFEDFSDEIESSEKNNPRLPGIKEQNMMPITPCVCENTQSPINPVGISLIGAVSNSSFSTQLMSPERSPLPKKINTNPNTPRIDISRASSSSHQDSRDSSPEREIFDCCDPNSSKLGLGFGEDGTLDLRSSTEELDFHEPEENKKSKHIHQSSSPIIEESYVDHRKDSQCSDVVLLSISGRTSRLSSIGSQGSAQSRLSNASHISILSGQSTYSRCSSPHKTLLETSFCGSKKSESSKISVDQSDAKADSEEFEKVLLSRQHNPTEAVFAQDIKVDKNIPPEKPIRKYDIPHNDGTLNEKGNYTKTVKNHNQPQHPDIIMSKNGVQYIYIPLKGPLPVDYSVTKKLAYDRNKNKAGSKQVGSEYITVERTHNSKDKQKHSFGPISQSGLENEKPKYIRIKLKPDNCYEQDKGTINMDDRFKPNTLNLSFIKVEEQFNVTQSQKYDQTPSITIRNQTRSLTSTPSVSPKFSRKKGSSNKDSSTPSPSVSRRNSLASLFKSKETMVIPDSPSNSTHKIKNTLSEVFKSSTGSRKVKTKSPSMAPSSIESIDNKCKHKSVLSIFKTNKKEMFNADIKNEPKLVEKVEFRFNKILDHPNKKTNGKPLEGDSIRIPLHSPTYYEEKPIFQKKKTSSQNSQDIEKDVLTDDNINLSSQTMESNLEVNVNLFQIEDSQQLNTSIENVINSTSLNVGNTLFTKELPSLCSEGMSIFQENRIIGNNKRTQSNKKTSIQKTKGSLSDILSKNVPTTPEDSFRQISGNNFSPEHGTTTIIDIQQKMQSKQQLHTCNPVINLKLNNLNANEDHNSSESERDSESDYSKSEKVANLKLDLELTGHEQKAIFLQDSFEDELPYVPTTLPQERSAAVPIIPVKQRSALDLKTCPIERPRSTTSIIQSGFENYCEDLVGKFESEKVSVIMLEKLKISLPRNDLLPKTCKENKNSGKGETNSVKTESTQEDTPPPLPPKGVQKFWINVEEVVEKPKQPKRIQTIPSMGQIDLPELLVKDTVVYTYVNPEDCKCECHEIKDQEKRKIEQHVIREDKMLLLDNDGKCNTNERDKHQCKEITNPRNTLLEEKEIFGITDVSRSIDVTDVSRCIQVNTYVGMIKK